MLGQTNIFNHKDFLMYYERFSNLYNYYKILSEIYWGDKLIAQATFETYLDKIYKYYFIEKIMNKHNFFEKSTS